jgi:hypothetical protein
MNGGKFASLTAELLVRKGAARPPLGATASIINLPLPHGLKPRLERREPAEVLTAAREKEPREHDAAAEETKPSRTGREASCGKPPPSPPGPPAKPRRLMVTLTGAEFETLGHMSVKKGFTRHQLVRNALDEYMALLGEEYGGDCQCIYTGCSCDNPG